MYLIEVKTRFIGFHRYKKASENVKFLRDWHRHLFGVEVLLQVNHGERDIEFFTFQEQLDKFIKKNYENKFFEKSCEYIAEEIALKFNCVEVKISEDGENAGIFINHNL